MKSRVEAALSTLGRSSDLLDSVDYQLARTPAEKEAIYHLRYRAYLREGAVKESPEQLFARMDAMGADPIFPEGRKQNLAPIREYFE